jgi:hypothetical protein
MLFALLNKEKIIGLFDNEDMCNYTKEGMEQFVSKKNLSIVKYHNNTICRIKNEKKKEEEKVVEKVNIDMSKKSDVEYNINLLKKEKEKLENKKEVYEVDLELYKKFKKIKEDDEDFEIPDMFEEKYEIFSVLEEMDSVNFESFDKMFDGVKIKTSYDDMFNASEGIYENLQITGKNMVYMA